MFQPSLLEIAIFAASLTASSALFWRRFGPVVANIRAARPEPGFSLDPIGKRAWDFVSEVLLQSKVIKERPLPGLAHAFVFWGFLAFSVVTLNHFAAGFGIAFLSEGSAYFYVAGAFATLVTISITALFIRRFFVRPKWLGDKVSKESGIIAGLIVILMLTFWPTDSKLLWWSHTLALLVFLPLVPHTKHLHLILSPLSVFMSRGSFAQIPPLQGDEDFGLHTGKDLTQIIALQTYSCVECGRCSEHCPATNTSKLLNPKEIALGVRGYMNEFGPASEEPLLGKHLSQEAAFQCTTCGACEYQCPVGIEHLPVIIGLRRGATNTGEWEDSKGTKLFLALERNGNALGFPSAERDKFIQKEQFPIYDGSQEYCLWLGCMGAYDPRGREIVTAFVRVMQHLGTSYGVLQKEKCTGDPARRLGNDLVFQQLAEANLEALKKNQVKKIISICPHCVRTIAKDWAEYGPAPEIEHHSEFLARHQSQLPQADGGSIVFHDPCYLGRYRGSYDAPREVLAKAGTVQDPERSRERGFCCGAGGGLAFLGEESGDRISHNRAKELLATGAQTVAAACPFCNTMLRDGLAAVSQTPPQLFDIAEITAANLSKNTKF